MRLAFIFITAFLLALPVTANASVCHTLADYAEEMMRQHQFPAERGGFNVHESARRTRDVQLIDFVEKLQRLVWSHDRPVTERRRREVVHSFSQEIYDLCASSE